MMSERFHKPIIEHLIATGRAEKLAVIYLLNEFGYPENELLDGPENWNNAENWKEVRAEALANTALRILDYGKQYVADTVPVGIKFASVVNPNTGWTAFESSSPDELAKVLNSMATEKEILGYDVYFKDGDKYDQSNKARFEPFLDSFKDGLFEISEFGHYCNGCPGEFNQGQRTSADDITGAANYWQPAHGLNLFAWNASGDSQGCYGLTDTPNSNLLPGAEAELQGLSSLMTKFDQQTSNDTEDHTPTESSSGYLAFLWERIKNFFR